MKILIIEDSNFSMVLMERRLLEIWPDSEIIMAAEGQLGINRFDQENPDLVVTDLLMPDVTGETIVKHVRTQNKQCFICVASANVQKMIQQELKEMGADLFIEKPISPEKAQILKENYDQKMKVFQ